MSFKKGCLKPALFGCLGIIVIGFLFGGIMAVLAWRGVGKQQIEDRELGPVVISPSHGPGQVSGRVILDLKHGEFGIHPSRPGEGLKVRAHYDQEAFELTDHLESRPDSSWTYWVRFRRTIPGLQALFRALMGGDTDTYVYVYLPPDMNIALELLSEEGGLEADLSGLWISEADIRFSKGGFSLSVREPLREPIKWLAIRGRMGGFEARELGNASPRSLIVDCKMGGADVDLRGNWVQDCDIQLAVRMGGMAVLVPDEVEVEGVPVGGSFFRREGREVPLPVLRFSVSERMGEIEVTRR
jgi:hypothetical protein